MMIHKASKFRIYPNKEQSILINKTIGCCRFVYNHFLNAENEAYKNKQKSIGYVGCAKLLTQLKKQSETHWLKEVDSTALQSSLRNLETSRQNFFQKRAKFPKFKSKKNPVQSYTTKNNKGSIRIEENFVLLPKVGYVRFAKSREITGRIMNATIRRNPSGNYFVSILCETEAAPLPKTGSAIGLDLGLTEFGTLSTGDVLERQRYTQKYEAKLAKAQRILARRVKGSNNWQKQRIKVARIHKKIANARLDAFHKDSTTLVKNHDILCVEDLNVSALLQEKLETETNKAKAKRAKNIADVSWSKFLELLHYKCEWYGKILIKVDRYFPSTQLCSTCHEQHGPKGDLSIRSWTCPNCQTQHQRDINAAINLLNEGLRLLEAQTVGTTGLA